MKRAFEQSAVFNFLSPSTIEQGRYLKSPLEKKGLKKPTKKMLFIPARTIGELDRRNDDGNLTKVSLFKLTF